MDIFKVTHQRKTTSIVGGTSNDGLSTLLNHVSCVDGTLRIDCPRIKDTLIVRLTRSETRTLRDYLVQM